MGNLTGKTFLGIFSKQTTLLKSMAKARKVKQLKSSKNLNNKGEIMVNKKLEIVFIDKEGKWYPLDEVDHEDLAVGLEKVSKEIAKRLQLLKEQR